MSPSTLTNMAETPRVVLLVEDEALVRSMLADEMRVAGLEVVEAANADEAWAFLQGGGRADLVFSDVTMPGSMDGIGLMRRVRDAFPGMKIVMTSGNLGPRDAREFDDFVAKPFLFSRAVAVAVSVLGLDEPGRG